MVASVAAVGFFASAAHAGDVTRVALGSSIEELVVGADGGAWVEISRPRGGAIGRAAPDGRFTTAGIDDAPRGAALGPDGQAWFAFGEGEFVRSDPAGKLTPVSLPRGGPVLGGTLGTGPDGTLWRLTPSGDRAAHVTPAGAATYTSTQVPDCGDTEFESSGSSSPRSLERASDGAMWFSDGGCERLVRIGPTGTTQVKIKLPDPGDLAADASGGVWFAGDQPGHVDAAGKVTRFELRSPGAQDVAVAPDGSAWFATGTCMLTRVTAGGEVTTAPTPIPARRIGIDPAGGMWLASRARLVHLTPGEGFGTCDERPPSLRFSPGGQSVSLRALRRAGVRLTVREPVLIAGLAFYGDDDGELGTRSSDLGETIVTEAKGRTVRFRLPAKQLRRFEQSLVAGKRARLDLLIAVVDREGNAAAEQYSVRVRD